MLKRNKLTSPNGDDIKIGCSNNTVVLSTLFIVNKIINNESFIDERVSGDTSDNTRNRQKTKKKYKTFMDVLKND